MCTAVLSIEPGGQVLLAGVRDELADRAWQPPGRHWPDYPALTGGRDLLAGGTWLAVAGAVRRVACVLNGTGRKAPARSRRSRGALPLLGAADGQLERAGLEDFDPFHLLTAEPGMAVLRSWDGERLTERELTAGLHMVVNSGLCRDLLRGDTPGSGYQGRPPALRDAETDHETARVTHFLPRFRAAIRPVPRPGSPVAQAWGAWLPLMNGDGLPPEDPRALIVRRELGGGRVWGTTSVSLVALSPDGLRYDFCGTPGDPAAWRPVPVMP
jgi:hypothetical protein